MRKVIVIIVTCMALIAAGCSSFDANHENSDIALDLDNMETWFDDTAAKLSDDNIAHIRLGMSFEEVVNAIGKPRSSIGSGAFVFEWQLSSGSVLDVTFNPVVRRQALGDLEVYLFMVKPGRS